MIVEKHQEQNHQDCRYILFVKYDSRMLAKAKEEIAAVWQIVWKLRYKIWKNCKKWKYKNRELYKIKIYKERLFIRSLWPKDFFNHLDYNSFKAFKIIFRIFDITVNNSCKTSRTWILIVLKKFQDFKIAPI